MTTTQPGLELPIDLDLLPARTRSWIITKSAAEGIDPGRLAHDLLVSAAARDGFGESPALPAAPTDPSLNVSPTEEGQP